MPVFLTAAEVVKLVDTHVSGACVARHAGSSPAFGTKPFSSLNGFFFWSAGKAMPIGVGIGGIRGVLSSTGQVIF